MDIETYKLVHDVAINAVKKLDEELHNINLINENERIAAFLGTLHIINGAASLATAETKEEALKIARLIYDNTKQMILSNAARAFGEINDKKNH